MTSGRVHIITLDKINIEAPACKPADAIVTLSMLKKTRKTLSKKKKKTTRKAVSDSQKTLAEKAGKSNIANLQVSFSPSGTRQAAEHFGQNSQSSKIT